ncbi:molybdenum cofactor guanylyltransferase [Desulfosarcina sp. BuS5]|uniref:molybdenum cofactor guanylyltransferase n=1 Tax=Desulfosarcina sp. BuS5 TaxID=933262 RepID=UPI000486054F|nr:molybdenum cofactor guanylyltransferase [Desulfosarcina sp. BuS5]WDN88107.1 molybdenum cofactor guanylyltransferase [Desulfosarcina sp. BuS5]
MKKKCTGVILAGGRNRRFGGRNKAFIDIGGRLVLDRLYSVFKSLFREIILVTNDPLSYLKWDFKIVTDLFPYRSSITGIHAGLFFATNPYAFITACDVPFLEKELVGALVNSIGTGIDAVIPQTSKGVEPLCSVYSTNCIKPVEQQIQRQQFQIQRLYGKIRTKYIPESALREIDPDLRSFCNINTPEDFAMAEKLGASQSV